MQVYTILELYYAPSSFRISSPSLTYSARHSGFRKVAELIELTGAPLMTLRTGTARCWPSPPTRRALLTFDTLACESDGNVADLQYPCGDVSRTPG